MAFTANPQMFCCRKRAERDRVPVGEWVVVATQRRGRIRISPLLVVIFCALLHNHTAMPYSRALDRRRTRRPSPTKSALPMAQGLGASSVSADWPFVSLPR